METPFFLELKDFLTKTGHKFTVGENYFFLPDLSFLIEAAPLCDISGCSGRGLSVEINAKKQCRVYEDLWHTKGDIIRDMIMANLESGEKIFARKCSVVKLDSKSAGDFFHRNHLLGDAKSKFRYGLFFKGELVAAASFSASRPMVREESVVESYEWVRYASKGSSRVSGGMGKLLSHFVKEQRPQEIMSYTDADWNTGSVYEKLGFKKTGATAPVEFLVNRTTFERVPVKKITRDNRYKSSEFRDYEWVLLFNSGNFKFLRRFSLL